MSKALYRKYRSKSLNEIVGQSHITDVLTRALKQGKVAHAYLLTGPRGVGKTSIARILAHEINQLPYEDESNHLDIIEIDAASNNGVDDIRDLRDKVQLAPISAGKKVYIIDEVHMLSKAAFNALLKTLEEPPEHVVFILATTNIEKLPDTIISRTQRFGFRLISVDDAISHLREIAQKENITISDEALRMVAERGKGSFRDSISLLDQLSSLANDATGITPELIEKTLGLAPDRIITALLEAVVANDSHAVINTLSESERSGVETTILIDQLIHAVKEKIVDAPQLLPLLDNLLEAAVSARPSARLLTALLQVTLKQKPASIAQAATPVPTISRPVSQLAQSPVRPTPMQITPKLPEKPVLSSPPPQPVAPEREVVEAHPENFNWDAILEHTHKRNVALHSVLAKCSYSLDGDVLTLYTIRKFNKTKLDDIKYRTVLAECLIETGAGDLSIETIPTAAPPTDKTAASVAALMGGGEEVNVE